MQARLLGYVIKIDAKEINEQLQASETTSIGSAHLRFPVESPVRSRRARNQEKMYKREI